jgi:hypothetical protein
MSARRLVLALALVATVCGAPAVADPTELTPLFVIPTESRVTQLVPRGTSLRVLLQSADVGRLAASLGVPAPAPDGGGIEYTLDGSPPSPPPAAGRTWLESTFVIDHDDAHVVAFRDDFRREHPGPPTAAAVVQFVAHRMQPSYDQGFALASRAATLLRGDCTEHAVLTAALARSVGLPAQVVVGVVVVELDGSYSTFGHAWTIIRESDRWVVSDAALAREDINPRYLPLTWLQDEGPGYAMQFLDSVTNWVRRVVVLGAAPSPQSEPKS